MGKRQPKDELAQPGQAQAAFSGALKCFSSSSGGFCEASSALDLGDGTALAFSDKADAAGFQAYRFDPAMPQRGAEPVAIDPGLSIRKIESASNMPGGRALLFSAFDRDAEKGAYETMAVVELPKKPGEGLKLVARNADPAGMRDALAAYAAERDGLAAPYKAIKIEGTAYRDGEVYVSWREAGSEPDSDRHPAYFAKAKLLVEGSRAELGPLVPAGLPDLPLPKGHSISELASLKDGRWAALTSWETPERNGGRLWVLDGGAWKDMFGKDFGNKPEALAQLPSGNLLVLFDDDRRLAQDLGIPRYAGEAAFLLAKIRQRREGAGCIEGGNGCRAHEKKLGRDER